MEFEAKTIDEMHEMSLNDLRDYVRSVYLHVSDAGAIRDYRSQIGEPKLLPQPTEVEYSEEEE
tara:strand:- start:1819 stop:2007 length:189 start_codon:yes stop_codon:yes gene_type:complete